MYNTDVFSKIIVWSGSQCQPQDGRVVHNNMRNFTNILIMAMPFLSAVSANTWTDVGRNVFNLDLSWNFEMASSDDFDCSNDTFPLDFSGVQCKGLSEQPYVDSAEGCREACCGSSTCLVWQWCPAGGSCNEETCWIGPSTDDCSTVSKDWVGGGRDSLPPPPPPTTSCNVTEVPECGGSSFDDSDWRVLDVPHDFVVEGTFDPSADKDHGYLPFGIAWYRKHFFLPSQASATTNTLVFDGVMVSCEVYLNGVLLGTHDGGYTPFRFDLSSFDGLLNYGSDENVVAVKVDSTNPDSWWYDGGGIYRHVWIECVVPQAHVGLWGVYAPASVVGDITSAQTATSPAVADALLSATVDVENTVLSTSSTSSSSSQEVAGTTTQGVRVTCTVYAASDEARAWPLASTTTDLDGGGGLAPGSTQTLACELPLQGIDLWSVEFPSMYVLDTFVQVKQQQQQEAGSGAAAEDGGDDEDDDDVYVTTDSVSTSFGVRTLGWDADKGFFLNGQPVKILGCANHQDFAGLGVAIPDSLQAWRISKMQELGGNAWRTAHNAPTEALLDFADQMGMLVWDENHRNGLTEDAEVLVRRDRNHPSIIIWSICNEVLCDAGDGVNGPNSVAAAHDIRSVYEAWDGKGPKRYISANQNQWVYNGSVLELLGYDYATSSYDAYHAKTPAYPAISSETSSAVSDRGEYSNDEATGHVTGYDTEAPNWGQTAEQAWGGVDEPDSQGILSREYMAGGFVWTGFDYKGEPTPYAWPDVNSHFGILDIAGFPKDRAFWYQAWWKQDTPLLYLFPHWNWEDSSSQQQEQEESNRSSFSHFAACSGMCKEVKSSTSSMEVEVWAFTNFPEVELLLNGKSLGRQAAPQYAHVNWTVAYAQGTLQAKGYATIGDQEPAQVVEVETVGKPAALRLSVVKDNGMAGSLSDDGSDVALVVAEVVDSQGRVVPTITGGVNVTFSVQLQQDPASASSSSASAAAAAVIDGTGNGDPSDHTSDKASTRPAYHGLVLGLVRAVAGAAVAGELVTVQASAPGLEGATVDLSVVASAFAFPRI